MVRVRPLRLRLVHQNWATRVASPAHDSMTPARRRHFLAEHPDSYMAVTRGLEDLDPDDGTTADELLRRGRASLDRLRDLGAFSHERGDEFYLYRLELDTGVGPPLRLTGIVAGVAVSDYAAGAVRIHEHVKANRALHLANHLDVVGVQSSPIAMAHRPMPWVPDMIERVSAGPAVLEVTLPDGLHQTVWTIDDPEIDAQLRHAFDTEPLYLIDGHHRAAAAATFRAAAGPGMADWMLSAIFPSDQLANAPHHRVLRPPEGEKAALERIGRRHRLRHIERDQLDERANDEIAVYAKGDWYSLTLPFRTSAGTATERLADLDPSRLQDLVVDPMFHLDPEGDDPALTYLAGIAELDDLESLIDADGGILALMRHVPIDVLLDAADHGLVMPPKSTYFQPKVRSGVFIRATTEEEHT